MQPLRWLWQPPVIMGGFLLRLRRWRPSEFRGASGNTDRESGHVDAELTARTAKHRITLGSAYDRAEDDHRKSEDNASGYSKYDYFLTEKLYLYLNGMAEKDTFRDINLRTTVGPGVGYMVFEGELMNLSMEAGPSDVFMFTRTDLRFPIRGGLSFNAGFEWDWDNTPAEGTDKSDYRYILSIGYGF